MIDPAGRSLCASLQANVIDEGQQWASSRPSPHEAQMSATLVPALIYAT